MPERERPHARCRPCRQPPDGSERRPAASGFAGQARPDGAAGPVEVRRIRKEVKVPVRRQENGLQLKGKLPRIAAWLQLSFCPGVLGCALEGVHPLVLALDDAVADGAWCLAVELGHGGGEEASPGEHGALEVGQE